MQSELIIISEYCDKCHIELSFIEMLQESGLIDIQAENGERYFVVSQLRMMTLQPLYYDLPNNVALCHPHLLERMEEMQREIHSLHNRLRLFEDF